MRVVIQTDHLRVAQLGCQLQMLPGELAKAGPQQWELGEDQQRLLPQIQTDTPAARLTEQAFGRRHAARTALQPGKLQQAMHQCIGDAQGRGIAQQ
ncbi:MAG: hypothetical protein A3J99_07330 [Sideroxydans sp. RIFOXYD2_FULL_59_7]|nr:MAG: hypothetical protein A3J99_07330 [Sideroxydans sp. RIFOXYD2_FULL_59_7]